jgi:hypothetical protein
LLFELVSARPQPEQNALFRPAKMVDSGDRAGTQGTAEIARRVNNKQNDDRGEGQRVPLQQNLRPRLTFSVGAFSRAESKQNRFLIETIASLLLLPGADGSISADLDHTHPERE